MLLWSCSVDILGRPAGIFCFVFFFQGKLRRSDSGEEGDGTGRNREGALQLGMQCKRRIKNNLKKIKTRQVWCHRPLAPAHRRLRQEDCLLEPRSSRLAGQYQFISEEEIKM